MRVRTLSYLDFDVVDLEAWRKLVVDVLGCEIRDDTADDVALLRLDHRHHRVGLRGADSDATTAVGWEVDDDRALDAVCERVRAFGVDVDQPSDDAAAERGVSGLARFVDPVGTPCELAWGVCDTGIPLRPAQPISGFKTGELGIGHLVVMADDLDKTCTFYREALGFRVSDTITIHGMRAVFLHCNPRHHSIAFVDAPASEVSGRLLHIMFEVLSLDDVGRAYERCLDGGAPIALSLGRHTNDEMTSFYLQTPSGFELEYGWGGRELPEGDVIAGHYSMPSRWGHRPVLDSRLTP